MEAPSDSIDQAVAKGGSYEILRKRLTAGGQALHSLVRELNSARQAEFGASGSQLVGKANVLTRARSLPVDMAQVGDLLLFGYQVFVGLKSAPSVDDVLGLYRLDLEDGAYRVEPVPLDGTFLDDKQFRHSFRELFTYYHSARLVQISRREHLVYVAFRIGERVQDLKVFRWQISGDRVEYIDDQGHVELSESRQQDLDWVLTTREDQVQGAYPHVSVADRVFVACTRGDLTIRVEDNTETGREIYSEPVDDPHQIISDAEISYAEAGGLILLKVLPNRERRHRYLIFNPVTETVHRADSLGRACKLLPEGHGVVFPNGYALTNGEAKLFEDGSTASGFFQTFTAPNGEDVLYCFFDPERGAYLMYAYNLIEKRFDPPLHSHGYSFLDDGRMLLFRLSENAEASTIHPLRVWRTPFMTPDQYARREGEAGEAFFRNLGNAELVRAISELNGIVQLSTGTEVTQTLYETLIEQCRVTLDSYHWLDEPRARGIAEKVRELAGEADRIIDEFAKARALSRRSAERLAQQAETQAELVTRVKLASGDDPGALIELLADVKARLGEVISLRRERYIDAGRVAELEKGLEGVRADLNQRLLRLLQDEKSYRDFHRRIDALDESLPDAATAAELARLEEDAAVLRARLALVTEEVAEIETGDPTETTRILDLTANVIARLNALDARLRNRLDGLRTREAEAEFASQFKLLAQTVTSALGQAASPEQTDEQLARLMGLVERLETRFADYDGFLTEIYAKRDEIQSSFESRKQQLLAARQRRVENIAGAADISLRSIEKRVEKLLELDELNAFFASDAMVIKLRHLVGEIRELGGAVRADGLEARLKSLQDQSLRALRDNKDIFEQGGEVLRLGLHRFSVHRQELGLTLVARGEGLDLHLVGTDYYQPVTDQEFLSLGRLAAMELVSETPEVYRGEYLAYLVLRAAEEGREELSIPALDRAREEGGLGDLVARYAAPRYREGYLKGVHDRDAARLLGALLPIYESAGLLRYGQAARARGLLWLAGRGEEALAGWAEQSRQALLLRSELSSGAGLDRVTALIARQMQGEHKPSLARYGGELEGEDGGSTRVSERGDLPPQSRRDSAEPPIPIEISGAADYLVHLLGQQASYMDSGGEWREANRPPAVRPRPALLPIAIGREAWEIAESYLALRRGLGWRAGGQDLQGVFEEHRRWLDAYCARHGGAGFVIEAALAATLKDHPTLRMTPVDFALSARLEGLLGQHPRIRDGVLELTLDDFLSRCRRHADQVVPRYEAFLTKRSDLIATARHELRLEELRPQPLTTFVRNRLISESYLPLIGGNFAKQMGALGAAKRTDQMGMLLLISPPGYGKTTLIEYLAGKLGLVFVKVNCPSVGHGVTSLDPAGAPSATSRREIEKLNLALEMGNNVLLYLDDMQHTNPEFLQKFISLSDATRRIQGVWKGVTRTYDMRGKRFALVMAGNPYTESGETFRVPDMLANRADIYNLGDMLSDQREAFELSYIENSLTSNPVLAPLATRDMDDLYRFVRIAGGEELPLSDMSHGYGQAEAGEILAVLRRLTRVQAVVLRVNQAYIASAAVAAAYRTEPPFKLQGSYRNMNKLAEQVVAVMTDGELDRLIADHYQGEAQTLAGGAEENLLKLGEILGTLDEAQAARWEEIKDLFRRDRDLGPEEDRGAQLVGQLDKVNRNLGVVAYSLYQRLKIERGDEVDSGDRDQEMTLSPPPSEKDL